MARLRWETAAVLARTTDGKKRRKKMDDEATWSTRNLDDVRGATDRVRVDARRRDGGGSCPFVADGV